MYLAARVGGFDWHCKDSGIIRGGCGYGLEPVTATLTPLVGTRERPGRVGREDA